ncbi:MAG: ABC transporter ATP-binding protein [Deltaproteobacteria bacterium]|nr:ABC transporter ATP-binding protein [Deltaproteobacteria bacterium]
MPDSTLLNLQDVTVHYGVICATEKVSFSVASGEIVTLIGANGAGKSTTLRAISGLLKPSSGTITFEGENIVGETPNVIVSKGIVHAPEGRGIFLNLSIEENLDLGAWTNPDSDSVKQQLEYVFKLFPRLLERRKQNAGTLSGGEQQMLAIGRALMAKPQLLLLDEPSLGLAPQLIELIFEIICEINKRGTTVLLVEQNAHQALEIAHRGVVLETGKVVLEGPASELKKSEAVQKAYLGG